MSKSPNDSSKKPETLDEAIARIESAGQNAASDLKEHLGSSFQQVASAIEQLKPQFESFKNKAEGRAKDAFGDAQTEVEMQMKRNPWLVLGFVGLLAFFIGWLLGSKTDNSGNNSKDKTRE